MELRIEPFEICQSCRLVTLLSKVVFQGFENIHQHGQNLKGALVIKENSSGTLSMCVTFSKIAAAAALVLHFRMKQSCRTNRKSSDQISLVEAAEKNVWNEAIEREKL